LKIAALDIGGTNIKYCLYDTEKPFSAELLRSVPTHAQRGAEYVIDHAIRTLEGLEKFDRIGVSTAGQVDPVSGTIIFASDTIRGYTGTQVARIFTEHFNKPTAVENDVNAAILAEVSFGTKNVEGCIIGLAYGTGIGGAIIQDGKLFAGSSNAAAEFGHMITHADGVRCICGQNGCYEAYASAAALIRNAERRFGKPVDGYEIARQRHEPAFKALLEDWYMEVVYGLINLVHIFNPHELILGGGIMENDFIMEAITERLIEKILPSYKHVKVKGARLGNASGLLGAIHLAQTMVI